MAIASEDGHVWVVDQGDNSVKMLNASELSLVKVLSAPRFGFHTPVAIAVDRTQCGWPMRTVIR